MLKPGHIRVVYELRAALDSPRNPNLGAWFVRNAGSVVLLVRVSQNTSRVKLKSPAKYPYCISASSPVRKFTAEQAKSKDILNTAKLRKTTTQKYFFLKISLLSWPGWISDVLLPIVLERYSHLREKALPCLLKLFEPFL